MKINIPQHGGLQLVKESNKMATPEDKEALKGPDDKVSFSSVLLAQQANVGLESEEQVDLEAVESIRSAMKDGHYEVDEEKLADAIMADLFGLEAWMQ